jgi:hypothetical protein
MRDFNKNLVGISGFQLYWSVIKPTLQKAINGIFHATHKPSYRFCRNLIWTTSPIVAGYFHVIKIAIPDKDEFV